MNTITGIGFFVTLIGLAGLAEAFEGNGKTYIAMIIVLVGIIICGSQTIKETIEDVKENGSSLNASYPCYLDFKRKRRR